MCVYRTVESVGFMHPDLLVRQDSAFNQAAAYNLSMCPFLQHKHNFGWIYYLGFIQYDPQEMTSPFMTLPHERSLKNPDKTLSMHIKCNISCD